MWYRILPLRSRVKSLLDSMLLPSRVTGHTGASWSTQDLDTKNSSTLRGVMLMLGKWSSEAQREHVQKVLDTVPSLYPEERERLYRLWIRLGLEWSQKSEPPVFHEPSHETQLQRRLLGRCIACDTPSSRTLLNRAFLCEQCSLSLAIQLSASQRDIPMWLKTLWGVP